LDKGSGTSSSSKEEGGSPDAGRKGPGGRSRARHFTEEEGETWEGGGVGRAIKKGKGRRSFFPKIDNDLGAVRLGSREPHNVSFPLHTGGTPEEGFGDRGKLFTLESSVMGKGGFEGRLGGGGSNKGERQLCDRPKGRGQSLAGLNSTLERAVSRKVRSYLTGTKEGRDWATKRSDSELRNEGERGEKKKHRSSGL